MSLKLYIFCVGKDAAPYQYEFTKTLPLQGHIQQLCKHFDLKDSADNYALQITDETKRYLSEGDIKSVNLKIPAGAKVMLTKSARRQALDSIEKLQNKTARKLACHFLSKQLSDMSFLQHFIHSDGMDILLGVCSEETGATLAYALNALIKSMEYGFGWDSIELPFLQHLAGMTDLRAQMPVNVTTGALKVLTMVAEKPKAIPFSMIHAEKFISTLLRLQTIRFDLLHAESKETYSKENPVHEAVLMALWRTVNPGVKLE